MRPAITLVTPTVPGRGDLLAELAASVAAQTYMPDAWLVGVDHERRGPAAVRNGLVAKAGTQWVAFVDDDDLLDPHHFETVAAHLDGSADVVYTLCRVPGEPVLEDIISAPFDVDRMLDDRNQVPVTVTMRRSTFVELGGFGTETARDEDYDLWRRALRAGARFRQVPEVTWTYRLDRAWGHRTWQEVA